MPIEITNRAVTYARTSGRSQDERLSHGGQDAVMFPYCKKKGLNIVKSFYEVASGLDSENRPTFLEMIQFVLNPENKISHVVCHDLSRFSRSKGDPHTYLKILDDNDIIIHSAADETNSDDDNDLLWDVYFIFNHQFSKTISQLTIRGQSESVKMGNDISTVVTYGYEKYYVTDDGKVQKAQDKDDKAQDEDDKKSRSRKTRRPRWKLHPEHSKHVLLIYTMRDQGYLPMGICNHLNALRIPAPRGGLWTTSTIRNILRNLAYRGYSQVGKTSKSAFPRHRRKRELVQNPNAHPAIIPEDLWNRVQNLMLKKPIAERQPPRSPGSPNPLSDRTKCVKRGHNANMVVANSTDGGKKLKCAVKKNSGGGYCDSEDIDLEVFLKAVGTALKERLSTPSIIQEQLDAMIKNSGELVEVEKEKQAARTKRSKEIDQEKANLMAALSAAKKDFPENVLDFNKALSALNKEKEQLEQQQTERDEDTSELMAFLADPEGPMDALMELGERIDLEDREVTSRFLQSFINRVDICGDEATIYYAMPLSNTVKTPDGYRASVPIDRGGTEILLGDCGPAEPSLVKTGVHQPQPQTRRPQVLPHRLAPMRWRVIPDHLQRPGVPLTQLHQEGGRGSRVAVPSSDVDVARVMGAFHCNEGKRGVAGPRRWTPRNCRPSGTSWTTAGR